MPLRDILSTVVTSVLLVIAFASTLLPSGCAPKPAEFFFFNTGVHK
jgi:hypothetical protein